MTTRLGVRQQLLAGTGALLALRLVLAVPRTGPLVLADEAGYLTNARVLAGGISGQMSLSPFYRGGYSLVVAPLVAVGAGPESTYRLALALNAVLAASLAPLLYLLLRRCFDASPEAALWPALAAALYPSITLFSQVALSENLLLPLVVVWLLCFGGLLDARTERGRVVWGGALGACTAALYAVHGRMVVGVGLVVLALIVLVLVRRVRVVPAMVAGGFLAAGLVGARLLDDFLVSRNFGGHQPDEVGSRLSSLRSVSGLASVLRNLVGQSWYLMVATLGLLAVLAVGRHLPRLSANRRRAVSSSQLVLALLSTTAIGLLVLSALSFRDLERADMLIYGRYTEAALPPLLAVALFFFPSAARSLRLRLAAALMVVATAAVVALRAGIHPPRAPNRWDVASLPFPTFGLGAALLAGAGAVAVGALIALAVVVRRAPALLTPAIIVLFLLVTALVENNPARSGQQSVYPAGWTSPASAAPRARLVDYDTDHYDTIGLYVYQWFMPRARFELFSGAHERPTARYVISSRAWGRLHPRLRAQVLWSDPGRDQALYSLASAETTGSTLADALPTTSRSGTVERQPSGRRSFLTAAAARR